VHLFKPEGAARRTYSDGLLNGELPPRVNQTNQSVRRPNPEAHRRAYQDAVICVTLVPMRRPAVCPLAGWSGYWQSAPGCATCENERSCRQHSPIVRAYGWAPSTRLFEAAASGACIISDIWPGLDELFEPDVEVLLADSRQDVLRHLDQLSPARQTRIGAAARDRVLREHTYGCRAEQVEAALQRCLAVSAAQKGEACASAS
jgi:hypothetical protein